jgi:hypothetical protein
VRAAGEVQPMWVMEVTVDWMIAALVMSLVGLWLIAQLRIWRTSAEPECAVLAAPNEFAPWGANS